MYRTPIAVLVSALVASPVALAQTTNQSSTPMPDRQQATGASQAGGSAANTSTTTPENTNSAKPGMRATEVPVMSDEDHVVLPLERFWVQGDDRLVVYGVTEEDLERLGSYRDARSNYNNLGDTDETGLPEWRQRQ